MSYPNGRRALIPVVAVGFALAAAAAAPARQLVQASGSHSGLSAAASTRGPVVRAAAGESTATILPAEAQPSGIVELTRGWALAATVATPEGQRAAVLVAEDGRQRELPRLPGPPVALQERPAPLAVDGQLLGVAWLEGDDYTKLAVRTAEWDGRGWSPAETVSLPAHGSQMALSATLLGDATPLLVWSRFDGNDDEIVFSRRNGAGWSPPAPIHPVNDVPDILPQVVATPDAGALAVWSELIDGHYRLLVSRFDGDAWGMPRRLPGLGATAARFQIEGARALLLYESTEPRIWALAEIDPSSGRPLRGGQAVRGSEEAPAIDAGGAALVWPESGRRAALAWQEPANP
ncbi:MAG: hypothetical protein ACRD2Z_01100 [Thermoanaerobaculia bacterium]